MFLIDYQIHDPLISLFFWSKYSFTLIFFWDLLWLTRSCFLIIFLLIFCIFKLFDTSFIWVIKLQLTLFVIFSHFLYFSQVFLDNLWFSICILRFIILFLIIFFCMNYFFQLNQYFQILISLFCHGFILIIYFCSFLSFLFPITVHPVFFQPSLNFFNNHLLCFLLTCLSLFTHSNCFQFPFYFFLKFHFHSYNFQGLFLNIGLILMKKNLVHLLGFFWILLVILANWLWTHILSIFIWALCSFRPHLIFIIQFSWLHFYFLLVVAKALPFF